MMPWSRCETDGQRLDVHNGLLLSALWDAAFDAGLVTFDYDGRVLSDYHGEMDDGPSRADEIKHRVAEDPRIVSVRRSLAVTERMREILPKGRNFH